MQNKKHIMLDIEALGMAPGGVITQIAACRFDPIGGTIDTVNTLNLSLDFTKQENRLIDHGTLAFWLKEDNAIFRKTLEGSWTLPDALDELARFVKAEETEAVWANGVTYDFAMLDDAYKQHCRKSPWSYRQICCLRSLRSLVTIDIPDNKDKHLAISDCFWQAQWLIAALAKLRGDKL